PAAAVPKGSESLEHGVGRAGHDVKLHGVAVRSCGSREHDQVGDAGVGGEYVYELLGEVGRANQANVKGHRRSTPAPRCHVMLIVSSSTVYRPSMKSSRSIQDDVSHTNT